MESPSPAWGKSVSSHLPAAAWLSPSLSTWGWLCPGRGCPVLTADSWGPAPLLRPPTRCGEGQYAERSKCPWLQSSLFSFLIPWTSCHRSWIDSFPNFSLAHFRMQLELGTWLKASLPSSSNSSRTYPTRGSYICTRVTLRRLPSEGRWPRNSKEQPMPCFHCLLPGLTAAGHSDWPFQNMPVCIKPVFTPSDPRPYSKLDFNFQNHYQGFSESGQPKVEKTVKRTTHWLQLLTSLRGRPLLTHEQVPLCGFWVNFLSLRQFLNLP